MYDLPNRREFRDLSIYTVKIGFWRSDFANFGREVAAVLVDFEVIGEAELQGVGGVGCSRHGGRGGGV